MKKLCFLLLLCACVMQTYAQFATDNTENKRYAQTQKKITFAVQPLQLFNNGLRYDFEIRLGNGPGWLQFGPAFYFLPNNTNNSAYYYEGNDYFYDRYNFSWREPYNKLKGIGLDINYKHFLDSRRSLYMAAGLSYTRFDIKYRSQDRNDYIKDDIMYYYESGKGYNTQKIDRFGINHFVGFQIPTRGAFLFDMFGGYAVRFSFAEEDKPLFNNAMFSYGYSGIVALIGFRIGFGIR